MRTVRCSIRSGPTSPREGVSGGRAGAEHDSRRPLSVTVIGATNDVDRIFRVPATTQVSGGVAHEFRHWLNASVDVVYTRGMNLYIIRNTNLDPVTLQRVNPNYTSISSFGNGGASRYRALQVQANIIPSGPHFVKVAYTLATNRSNTNTTLSTGAATNPFDYSEDEGPADNDVRHNLTVNGVALLPLGVQLSGNRKLSQRAAVQRDDERAAPDGIPFAFRPEPRNARRGDSAVSVDVRLGESRQAWHPPFGDRVRRGVQPHQSHELRQLHRDRHLDPVRRAHHRVAEAPDPTGHSSGLLVFWIRFLGRPRFKVLASAAPGAVSFVQGSDPES